MTTPSNLVRTIGLASVILTWGGQAAAAYQICGRTYSDQVSGTADVSAMTMDFVRRMKIAKAQGDIVGMNVLYNSYFTGFAAKCDDSNPPQVEFRQVCGVDCHVQLAEYHLFEASDIEYYSSQAMGASSPPLLKPEQMAAHVVAGVALIESAEALLNKTSSDGDFRDYLQAIGHLNLLKAKLYMASGDAWYKAISEKRVARLAYLVSNAIDQDPANPPPGFPIAGSSMLELAGAGYEAALWGLNEALMEIPDEHYFDALTLEAKALVGELKLRRDSLKKGLIFIGIDPDDYKLMNIADLKSRLQEDATAVKGLESQIETVVKTYLAAAQQIEDSNVNNAQALASQSISLSSYKIAVIENLADQQRQVLSTKIDDLNAVNQGYEQEYRRAQLVFTMNAQVAEAQNKLARLQGTQEVDALNFQNQQVVQRRNDLQWLTNQDVSTTHLLLQIDALAASFVTMDRDVAKATLDKEQIADRITRAQNDIDTAKRDIENNQGEIDKLKAQQGPIFQLTQRASAAAICQTESELMRLKGASAIPTPFAWTENGVAKTCDSFSLPSGPIIDPTLGTQADYIQKRCGMKQKLSQLSITTSADALVCVIGVDLLPQSVKDSLNAYLKQQQPSQTLDTYAASHCSALKSACDGIPNDPGGITCDTTYASARAVYGEQLKLAQQQVDALQQQLATLQATRDWMDQQLDIQKATKAADTALWAAKISGLIAAETAAAALPKVTMGALLGPMGGAIMLDCSMWMLPKQEADAAVEAAKLIQQGLQQAEGWEQFLFRTQQALRGMDLQVDKAKADFDQAKTKAELEKYQTAQVLMQMTGSSLDLGSRLAAVLSDAEMTALDCSNQVDTLNREVARLQLQHESLVSQAAAALAQNDLLALGIQKFERLITNDASAIANLNSQIDELSLEGQKIQQDIDAIQGNAQTVGLRKRTQMQIDKINALLGRINATMDDLQALRQVRDTLQSDVFAKSTALNAEEMKYLQTVMRDDVSYTRDMISRINGIEAVNQDVAELKGKLNAQYQAMYAAVGVEKANMVKTAEGMYAGTLANPMEQIYLTNEELVATLTRGIPDFLREKRNLMETANYQLGLLYTKVRALTSTVSSNAAFGLANDGDPIAYARTGQDIQYAIDSAANDLLRNQAVIQSEVVGIDIPYASGLARQLQLDHAAEFAITPLAANRMDDLGYFALWHPVFGEASAFTVLDIRLLVQPKTVGCMERVFTLEHEGSGFRFVGLPGGSAEPLLFAGPPRAVAMKYYLQESEITDFKNAWKPLMSLLGFWNNEVHLSYDPETLLPLLGVPVIGTYRITLPDPYSENTGSNTCTYDDAIFRLVIAYAKSSQL